MPLGPIGDPGYFEYKEPRGRTRVMLFRAVLTIGLMAASASVIITGIRHLKAWPERERAAAIARAADFVFSPDTVVLEGDPSEAERLCRPGNHYHRLFGGNAGPAVRYLPADIREVTGVDSPVFFHERANDSRQHRYVCVNVGFSDRGGSDAIGLYYDVESSLFGLHRRHALGFTDFPANLSAIRLYAGQPDPSNASRFTIRVVIDGRARTIVGRLLSDDTVTFKYED